MGCSDLVTPNTDETKIKEVIQNYTLAMNNQDWDKAKGYCVFGSGTYYETCDMEQYINSLAPYGLEGW